MFEAELESLENTIDSILKGEIHSDLLQNESEYRNIKKQINNFDVKVKLKLVICAKVTNTKLLHNKLILNLSTIFYLGQMV